MLLTISDSEPVSTGRFIANYLMQEYLAIVADCRKDADPSPHAHTSTSKSKISWSLNGLQLCFHNSDAEDHDPEKCEHGNTKMFKSHGDDTTQRWLKDIHLDDELELMSKIIQLIKQVS